MDKSLPQFYKLLHLQISTEVPVLIDRNNQKTDLEPKIWHLLLYFCENPGKIITRDDIIEHVNQGTIVSDNAINKTVAKARKILGDSSSAPLFIKTIPKQGYCLIADVEWIYVEQAVKPAYKNIPNKLIYALIILVLAANYYILSNGDSSENSINTKLTPMTYHKGIENKPNISPDGRYLLFSRSITADTPIEWKLLDLRTEEERPIRISNPNSPIVWRQDGKSFLYVAYNEGECSVIEMHVATSGTSTTPVAACGNKTIIDLALNQPENTLLYIARETHQAPWRIYQHDFETKTSKLINQPASWGLGNYAMDISPDYSRLLILSSGDKDQTVFHELDLNTRVLTQKGKRNRIIPNAIWHHDNETIIHTSDLYSKELINTDLSGAIKSVIVSTSKRMADNFERHPNGKDYYFTLFQINNDILSLNQESTLADTHINTEVYEKLPVFSDTGDDFYMVSNRTGVSQIFSVSHSTNKVKQITSFTGEHEFLSLDAAPNGKKLTFHNRHAVFTVDTATGDATEERVPSGQINSVLWLSNNQISISVTKNAQTHVQIYYVPSGVFSPAPERWQAVFSSPSGSKLFGIDRSDNTCLLYTSPSPRDS